MLKRSPHAAASRGFTLIESMIALAVSAIMASLSYPTFADQVRKARRVDAITRLAIVQLEQERWRANHSSYAALAAIGLSAQTADGLYQLAVLDADGAGYTVRAAALGGQLRDTACRVLQLSVAGGNTTRSSGPDANLGNAAGNNDRCWNR